MKVYCVVVLVESSAFLDKVYIEKEQAQERKKEIEGRGTYHPRSYGMSLSEPEVIYGVAVKTRNVQSREKTTP